MKLIKLSDLILSANLFRSAKMGANWIEILHGDQLFVIKENVTETWKLLTAQLNELSDNQEEDSPDINEDTAWDVSIKKTEFHEKTNEKIETILQARLLADDPEHIKEIIADTYASTMTTKYELHSYARVE